jgi:negative modulator of initiation of replication
MKEIEIEDDLYKYILANIEEFGETPSQILRRLLALPTTDENQPSNEKHSNNRLIKALPVAPQEVLPVDKKTVRAVDSISLPESVGHGVAALFADQTFKNEPIITNKFKMMLTAMYHENKAAFFVAANTTKGRTRDYLGVNLSELLASDNEEEVAQLKASKPHNIPHTPFWVITNANTGRKRIILTQMMASMKYPHHLIEQIKDEI